MVTMMSFQRHEIIARFGLMHMVATNLCVWLLAVVQESQHEIHHYYEHMQDLLQHKLEEMDRLDNSSNGIYEDRFENLNAGDIHQRTRRAALLDQQDSCRHTDVFSHSSKTSVRSSSTAPLNIMSFQRHEIIARFGLMHMVATNLCVWLLAVVQESQHEIHHYYEHMQDLLQHKLEEMDRLDNSSNGIYEDRFENLNAGDIHQRTRRAALLDQQDSCRHTDVFSQLVQDISPFLFPCTIEYSLICAAICYVLWKQVGKKRMRNVSDSFLDVPIRSHQYSVDCSHAIKGKI
uniref:Uncharacterized protein n=1 Tax=Strigamia maritima TaxID=126957 RepID=T1JIU7_STRMM